MPRLLRNLPACPAYACRPVVLGFALLGRKRGYQTTELGYNGAGMPDAILSARKNLGEEYRRNTPVVYYSFDANFLDFFGSKRVAAIRFRGRNNKQPY